MAPLRGWQAGGEYEVPRGCLWAMLPALVLWAVAILLIMYACSG